MFADLFRISSYADGVILRMWPWVEPYFKRRLLERRTSVLPRLHTIRTIAEELAARNDENYKTFALQLLQPSSRSARRFRELFHQSLRSETEESPLTNLVAAILTGTSSTMPASVWHCQREKQQAVFGSPYEAALIARNDTVIELLLQETEGPERLLKFAVKEHLPLVKRILQASHASADVADLWQGTRKRGDGKLRRGMANELLATPHIDIFEYLRSELQTGSIDAMSTKRISNYLTTASRNGWMNMVKHLLLHGARVDQRNQATHTFPLADACKGGHDGVVQVLLDHGARFWAGEVAGAVKHGHTATLKILLATKLPVDSLHFSDCLSHAAGRGYADIVQILLDYGVDPNTGSIPPLIAAVEAEHTGIFRMLIARGANASTVKDADRKRAESMGVESMLVMLDETTKLSRTGIHRSEEEGECVAFRVSD